MRLEQLTQAVKRNVQNVDDLMGSLEAMALAVTTRAAAWISTIPTVMLTSRTVAQVFNLSQGAGLASSIALEVVGQSCADLWLSARAWNDTKRKCDPAADTQLAFAMMMVYFVSDFVLVSVLELPKAFNGELGHLSSLLFPIMQVVSTLVLTERAKHFKWAAVVAAEKAERAAARADQHSPEPAAVNSVDALAQVVDKRQAILDYYFNHARATQTEVAQAVQCSRQYISQLLRKLESDGVIRKNGNGVEIVSMEESDTHDVA
ncbi:MAG: winged helix-turn-helix domain-containing protein [Anaerolineae bacterium]|nr:winged helix-turn-helix domain-containing protein [Anaerolineae bacterium]